jgi:hypothetical protein
MTDEPLSLLETEYRGYVRALNNKAYEALVAQGVNPWDVLVHQLVGLARVRVEGELWTPDPGGISMYVTPVRVHPQALLTEIETPNPWGWSRFGMLADVVAWRPSEPEQYALRMGDGRVLGSAESRLADEAVAPLQVHRSPLEWLRARGEGVMFLTRDENERRTLLLGIDQVRAANREHAEELQEMIARGRREPEVLMPGPEGGGVVQLDEHRQRRALRQQR